jgi:hypothetical protein
VLLLLLGGGRTVLLLGCGGGLAHDGREGGVLGHHVPTKDEGLAVSALVQEEREIWR